MREQGQYQVIFLDLTNFSTVKDDDFASVLSKKMIMLYREHAYLLNSQHLSQYDKNNFQKIFNAEKSVLDKMTLMDSLKILLQLISKHNELQQCEKLKPIVLVDGYDNLAPIACAPNRQEIAKGFYLALKSNYFECAVITGTSERPNILPNNFSYYSPENRCYSEYFGFTTREVKNLLATVALGDHYQEMKPDFFYSDAQPAFNPATTFDYIEMKMLEKNAENVQFRKHR